MAQKGEQADPRVPAPVELRPVLRFSRLSAAAYGVIARVIDEDGIFRARVAEAAEESEVGRVSWLWLHRPVGWLEDPAMSATGSAPSEPEERVDGTPPRRDDKAAATRLRKAAADADAARRRTADQLAEIRRAEAEVRAERDALAASIATLQEERHAAVRRSKEVEALLATARRDLKVARKATMDAEEELAAVRRGAASAPVPIASDAPAASAAPAASVAAPGAVSPAGPGFDREGVAASVSAAATAAADLAAALADAAGALTAPVAPAPAVLPGEVPPSPRSEAVADGAKPSKKRPKKGRKVSGRTQPALPPGVFDGTGEANRALLADAANLLVVDGYNVARAAWSGLAPEEERRRTVALLDDVQARSGGRVIVVFDGDSAVSAPKASKNVRVRFSASGQTADDAIVDLLGATADKVPVVVVSSDRAVAADARRQGAVAVGAREFLTAAGR